MPIRILCVLILCSLAAIAADPVPSRMLPDAPTVFVNAKLKRNQARLGKILLLPGRVEVTTVGLKDPGTAPEGVSSLEADVDAVIREDLRAHGATLLPDPIREGATTEERYALADLQRLYDNMESALLRRPNDVAKGRFSLGDEVAAYGPAAAADTIVFIRGRATMFAGRPSWKNSGTSPEGPRFDGQLAFVSARTGEVLALVEFTTYTIGWKQTAQELAACLHSAMVVSPGPMYYLLSDAQLARPRR